MEIHPSARRHGAADTDIEHALRNAIAWVELGDDPLRYLVVRPDEAGNLLELVVMDTDTEPMAIHAMKLRSSTEREVLGKEEQ